MIKMKRGCWNQVSPCLTACFWQGQGNTQGDPPVVEEHWTRSPEPCILILVSLTMVRLTITCKATYNTGLLLFTGSKWSLWSEVRMHLAPDGVVEPFSSWSGRQGSGKSMGLWPRESLCVSALSRGRAQWFGQCIQESLKNEGNDLYSCCLTKCIHMFICNCPQWAEFRWPRLLCDPLPVSVGDPCHLLLTHRMRQRWWDFGKSEGI